MKKVKTGIRQAQIKDAALRVITQRGLQGLTISAIAKRAGISCGNIYRHFKDKDALISAIVSEIGAGLGDIVDSASRKKTDPLSCLKTIFLKHIKFLEGNRGIFRFMLSDGLYSVDNKARVAVARYLGAIRRILLRGIRDGLFDRRLDVDAAARAFLGSIQGVGLQWILCNYTFSPQKRGRKIWRIFARGVLSRSR